jgi:hypothetical protein
MKKYFAFASGLLALSVMVALGADIDGKWTRETQGKNGPQTQTLTLKAEGSKLTGTMEQGGGGKAGPAAISDGKITGANVEFKVVREFGGNSVTQTYKGTVSATELKLTIEGAGKGGPQEAVFKKQ